MYRNKQIKNLAVYEICSGSDKIYDLDIPEYIISFLIKQGYSLWEIKNIKSKREKIEEPSYDLLITVKIKIEHPTKNLREILIISYKEEYWLGSGFKETVTTKFVNKERFQSKLDSFCFFKMDF